MLIADVPAAHREADTAGTARTRHLGTCLYPWVVWATLETRVVGFSSWRVAAVATILGWLLATALLIVGARPLGWVVLGSGLVTLAGAILYARARGLRLSEVAAFSFACMVLAWPILGFLSLFILSWVGVAKWE